MAGRTPVTGDLLAYIETITPEPEAMCELRDETSRMPVLAEMVSTAVQARLLALLTGLVGARRILEIGTFTGYSTLAMALAAPEGCVITTCDRAPRWTRIAEKHWENNGVAHKIDLRIGDADATLTGLTADGASFDLAYIDADKIGYPAYYRHCLRLVRPGGLILLDNAFCFGRVADDTAVDAETVAVREVNRLIAEDARAEHVTILPIGDGLSIVRRGGDFREGEDCGR
ncbi:SAM-dependent methyltransferase [Amycolatopsis sp. WAC 04197]|uniref:O-methyltransferase n=1 Tax=Amycolatopsis sp. WAC 04197 TaxID=2203199 RepID=UPI000F7B49F5|nr:class I SAM-dependent methyltransferase [Amycolatopsis sp. WAC 04197]RSN45177.1 SAM-dependent methyltransferase [Amycolatopsis sp. WAC 04197]